MSCRVVPESYKDLWSVTDRCQSTLLKTWQRCSCVKKGAVPLRQRNDAREPINRGVFGSGGASSVTAAQRGTLLSMPDHDQEREAQAQQRYEEHMSQNVCNCEFPNWCLFEAGFQSRSDDRKRLDLESCRRCGHTRAAHFLSNGHCGLGGCNCEGHER